ncbi:MAG TPA: disulfide bond formation protein B [Acetobacteraceae bacterium]|nr:disulfide bond formation protein B [Acetobacteraceae bacterium]
MTLLQTRTAALILALAGALALGGALASQYWIGLVPCALCLVERWPWRAVIVVGLIAASLPPRAGRWALGIGLIVLLASTALGAVHVGVELGLWKSPLPECAAPPLGTGSIAERLAAMPLRPAKPCDAPSYLVPGLPVSIAAMNLIWSVVVFLALAVYLACSRGSRR